MAVTLTGSVTSTVNWTYQSSDDISTTQDKGPLSVETAFTSGTGNDQVNRHYRYQGSVTAGSPNADFDLQATLLDRFGATLTFRTIKALIVRNLSTTAGDYLRVGPQSVANGFKHPWGYDPDAYNLVGPSGVLQIVDPKAGYDVGLSEQNLRIRHAGVSATINFQIVLYGVAGTEEVEMSSSSSSSSESGSSSASSSESSASESSASPSSSSQSVISSSSSSSSESSVSATSLSESSASAV